MTPERNHKLFNIGCFIVLVCLMACGILAYHLHPAYWIGCVCLIALWLLVCRLRDNRLKKLDVEAFHNAFEDLGDLKPRLDRRYSYSFPSFAVIFASKDLMDKAEDAGLIDRFRDSIQELYGYAGSKSNPFDSDRAVYATYDGRVHEFVTIKNE